MLCEKLVDTPVRGLVYEAAGSVGEAALERGLEVARDAHERWMIPLEELTAPPDDREAWLAAARAAVTRLLS
jgi:hypothetical protein